MSTREELAQTIQDVFDQGLGEYRLPGGRELRAADALIAEGWRKKPDDEALWDLADELLDGLNVYDENPPSLSEYIADRVRALMDRGQ